MAFLQCHDDLPYQGFFKPEAITTVFDQLKSKVSRKLIRKQGRLFPSYACAKRNAATWNSHKKGKTLWHWRKASDVCPTLTCTILFNISAYITLSLHNTNYLYFVILFSTANASVIARTTVYVGRKSHHPSSCTANTNKTCSLDAQLPNCPLPSPLRTDHEQCFTPACWHIDSYLMDTHQIYWYM